MEDQREAWGCESPAPAPLFSIVCPRCSGGSAECGRCKGAGEVAVHRCPGANIGADVALAFSCFAMLEQGILPAPGGWLDQTCAFAAFVGEVHAARRASEAREERRTEKLKRLAGAARSGRS